MVHRHQYHGEWLLKQINHGPVFERINKKVREYIGKRKEYFEEGVICQKPKGKLQKKEEPHHKIG